MLPILRRGYETVREYRYFLLRDELGSPIHVPLTTRMRMLWRGFLGHSSLLYDLSQNRLDDYISDLARVRMSRINSRHNRRAHYPAALDNKYFFAAILRRYLRIAEVFAIVSRGKVISICDEWPETADLFGMCESSGRPIVIKPITGAKGRSVLVLRKAQSKVELNGTSVSPDEVASIVENLDEYMVCEFLQQSSWSAQLYSESTNTMRILTLRDPQTGEPFIGAAVHRIGTKKSAPVDNWSQGGLSARIDLETGQLGPGATFPYSGSMQWFENHPDSGAPIAGSIIPGWEALKAEVLQVTRRLPFLKLVAWDLIQTDEGLAAIEGNSTTDVDLFQIHGPLLTNPRVREFFQYHRLIRNRRS